MKKILAALLALMLFAVPMLAGAEAAADTGYAAATDILNFNIRMDTVPEGYTFSSYTTEIGMAAAFKPNDESMPVYAVSIAYGEATDGYTLEGDISEEVLQMIVGDTLQDYNDPTVEMTTTAYGTPIILINENGAETDSMEIYTIFEGYNIMLFGWRDGELTDADIQRGIQIISDMWIIES